MKHPAPTVGFLLLLIGWLAWAGDKRTPSDGATEQQISAAIPLPNTPTIVESLKLLGDLPARWSNAIRPLTRGYLEKEFPDQVWVQTAPKYLSELQSVIAQLEAVASKMPNSVAQDIVQRFVANDKDILNGMQALFVSVTLGEEKGRRDLIFQKVLSAKAEEKRLNDELLAIVKTETGTPSSPELEANEKASIVVKSLKQLGDLPRRWNRAAAPVLRDYLDPKIEPARWVKESSPYLGELRAVYMQFRAIALSLPEPEAREYFRHFAENYGAKLDALVGLQNAVGRRDEKAEHEAYQTLVAAGQQGNRLSQDLMTKLRSEVPSEVTPPQMEKTAEEIGELMEPR